MTALHPQAGMARRERFDEGNGGQAESNEITEKAAEGHQDTEGAFRGETKGCTDKERWRKASGRMAEEQSITVLPSERFGRAESRENAGKVAARFLGGVTDVTSNLAHYVFTLCRRDGCEVGTECAKIVFSLLLIRHRVT